MPPASHDAGGLVPAPSRRGDDGDPGAATAAGPTRRAGATRSPLWRPVLVPIALRAGPGRPPQDRDVRAAGVPRARPVSSGRIGL